MTENRRQWTIPIGKTKLITVFADTKQILSHIPDPLKDVIVDVTIAEHSKD